MLQDGAANQLRHLRKRIGCLDRPRKLRGISTSARLVLPVVRAARAPVFRGKKQQNIDAVFAIFGCSVPSTPAGAQQSFNQNYFSLDALRHPAGNPVEICCDAAVVRFSARRLGGGGCAAGALSRHTGPQLNQIDRGLCCWALSTVCSVCGKVSLPLAGALIFRRQPLANQCETVTAATAYLMAGEQGDFGTRRLCRLTSPRWQQLRPGCCINVLPVGDPGFQSCRIVIKLKCAADPTSLANIFVGISAFLRPVPDMEEERLPYATHSAVFLRVRAAVPARSKQWKDALAGIDFCHQCSKSAGAVAGASKFSALPFLLPPALRNAFENRSVWW